MAFFDLPTSITEAFYEFEVSLDGVAFRLEFKFNERSEAWYMTIFDTANNVLRAGVKIVNEFPFLRTWQDVEKRPVGTMFTVIQGDEIAPATLKQLGEEIILIYSGET